MKSKKRIDEEIKAVASIWNGEPDIKVEEFRSRMASAIFHTLHWARGNREMAPSKRLRKIFEDPTKFV
jgi:hypothetical protein